VVIGFITLFIIIFTTSIGLIDSRKERKKIANFIHTTANRFRNNHYEIKRSVIEVERAKAHAEVPKSIT
jgi:hypothetical protein